METPDAGAGREAGPRGRVSIFFPDTRSWIILCVWLGLIPMLGGCYYTPDVIKAFDGKFAYDKSQKVITEYCQGCHNHRNFQADEHVAKMRKFYKKRVYHTSDDCRLCHYVERRFARNELIRKTRRPTLANKGKFTKHEKEMAKDVKKNLEKKEKKKKEGKSFWDWF